MVLAMPLLRWRKEQHTAQVNCSTAAENGDCPCVCRRSERVGRTPPRFTAHTGVPQTDRGRRAQRVSFDSEGRLT